MLRHPTRQDTYGALESALEMVQTLTYLTLNLPTHLYSIFFIHCGEIIIIIIIINLSFMFKLLCLVFIRP